MSGAPQADLNYIVSQARSIGLSRPVKGVHPVGFGIKRKDGFDLPLPAQGPGFSRLRDIMTQNIGVPAEFAESVWSSTFNSPGMRADVPVPDAAALRAQGIHVAGAALSRLRRRALATVFKLPEDASGTELTARFALVAEVTVLMSADDEETAEDAWMSIRICETTRQLQYALAAIPGIPTKRVQKPAGMTALVAPECVDAFRLVETFLETIAWMSGIRLSADAFDQRDYPKIAKGLRGSPPSLLALVGSCGNLRDAFLTGGTLDRLLEIDELDDIAASAAERIARVDNVDANLWLLKKRPAPSRPRIPISSALDCLHYPSKGWTYVQDAGDPSTWWTRDMAQHAGSTFKTFRKNGRHLIHVADHAADGTIINKWKGDIGREVPLADLHACPYPQSHVA